MSATLAEPTPSRDQQNRRRKLRIAYILHRFPCLTETFIMREMYWLREHNVDLQIYSLLPPIDEVVHQQARELLGHANYSPLLSWAVIRAQMYFLWRSPLRYVRALVRMIWQTYREPSVLARALAIFPVSVYFARLLKKQKIDHIHAHFVWLEGLAAGIAEDLLDITFTIQPHAHGLFLRNRRDVRRELENASRVITISSYHRAYIADLCPRIDASDIEVVYCGVESDRMQPASQSSRPGPLQIVSVGRLIEKKGYEYLIDACAALIRRGVDFRCQIVGEGRSETALKQRIRKDDLEDRVILLGALSQEKICDLYRQADILALPCVVARNGDRDGIPVVLMEAMAFGLPVVTTAVTGIPDLVRDQENGLLVEERNAADLAEALERLCADPGLRARLGSGARRTIVDNFDVCTNAAKMADVFQQIAEARLGQMVSQEY